MLKEPSPPLNKTQHIISGVAIILAIIILSIVAASVIKWQADLNEQNEPSAESLTTSETAAESVETTTALSADMLRPVKGSLDSVLPTSLARGDTLKVGMDETIDIINPLYSSSDGEKDLVSLIFESLVTLNDEGRPVPRLASSWQYDQDIRKLNFTISSGHFFRNGRSVSVDDVIFTYNCLTSDSYNGPYKGRFTEIVDISPGNTDDSIAFTFSTKVSEPDFSLFTIGILRQDYYDYSLERVFEMYDDKISPEGSGAFELTDLSDDSASVSLRPGYAGMIDSIYFEKISSEDKFSLLKEGKLDIVRSRWDSRMKIRSESLPAYNFYPSASRIESYVLIGSNFSSDTALTTNEHQTAALLAIAGFEISDMQQELLESVSKPLVWYYFKGVDEQVSARNLDEVIRLSAELKKYNIETEPVGLDWPEMAAMLENDDSYELMLLPAPSNNRLPQGTIMLTTTHSYNYSANANAWPSEFSNEVIIMNARILQSTIEQNSFPLSTSTAGWTSRLENIRFYDPSAYEGDIHEYEQSELSE